MGSLLNTLRSSKPPRIMSILYLLTVVGMVTACVPSTSDFHHSTRTTSTPASTTTTTTTTTSTPASVPGFIITGGSGRVSSKVEIFNPVSRRTCPLPNLPEGMYHHSHCGILLCSWKSCLKMNSTGSFSPAPVSLLKNRVDHLCWSLPGGGGAWSPKTTEVISSNFNSTKPSWGLKYKTDYACGVEVDDTFIITGGWDRSAPDRALNSVVRYNSQGDSEVLPSL